MNTASMNQFSKSKHIKIISANYLLRKNALKKHTYSKKPQNQYQQEKEEASPQDNYF